MRTNTRENDILALTGEKQDGGLNMSSFTVTAEPGISSDVWVLVCPEVGAVSQVKNLDDAADETREAIAYLAGIKQDEVDIEVEAI